MQTPTEKQEVEGVPSSESETDTHSYHWIRSVIDRIIISMNTEKEIVEECFHNLLCSFIPSFIYSIPTLGQALYKGISIRPWVYNGKQCR